MIPESLLAFKKDSRYLEEVNGLLQNIFEGHRGDESLSLNTWAVTLASYVLLVVSRKRKTLGMEALGIKFDDQRSTWLLSGQMLSLIGLIFLLRRRLIAENALQNSNNNERLTGDQRRQAFLRQRQAMLQRARQGADENDNASQKNLTAPSRRSRWKKRLTQVVHAVIEDLFRLESAQGPHVQRNSQIVGVAAWIFRLHLGIYSLQGKFPTLWLRLLGLKVTEDTTTSRGLVHRPITVRAVGALIVVHAAGTGLHGLAKLVARFFTYRWLPPSRNTVSVDFVGGHGAHGAHGAPEFSASALHDRCGICHKSREHPACPRACGHVFCWSCLQQWCRRHEACPLCRAKCRPQDVIALYGYQDATILAG